MIDQAAGSAMVMSCEVRAMAGNTLAAACDSRQDEAPGGHGVVAGGAPSCRMDFTCTDKW